LEGAPRRLGKKKREAERKKKRKKKIIEGRLGVKFVGLEISSNQIGQSAVGGGEEW